MIELLLKVRQLVQLLRAKDYQPAAILALELVLELLKTVKQPNVVAAMAPAPDGGPSELEQAMALLEQAKAELG